MSINEYAKVSSEQLQQMGLQPKLPGHVAIIMDGNGRWAQKRNLPRVMGHRAGMDRLHGIIRFASDMGIDALSLYAFSTENWKRPQEEIGALCGLLVEYFKKEIDELHKNGVRIRALGIQDPFPVSVRAAVQEAQRKTAQNNGLRLNIALNYGGQDELLRAARALAEEAQQGKLQPDELVLSMLEERLDTRGLPPVDLLIRTGGDQRISNFLLYQIAYAELLFVPEYWPDFTEERLTAALVEFQRRQRRFGGLEQSESEL